MCCRTGTASEVNPGLEFIMFVSNFYGRVLGVLQLVRGLNRAVASHVTLAGLLGGSGDGPNLRDELRRARRTAQEVAAVVRATLLPSLLE